MTYRVGCAPRDRRRPLADVAGTDYVVTVVWADRPADTGQVLTTAAGSRTGRQAALGIAMHCATRHPAARSCNAQHIHAAAVESSFHIVALQGWHRTQTHLTENVTDGKHQLKTEDTCALCKAFRHNRSALHLQFSK